MWRHRCLTCHLPWTKYGEADTRCPFCGSHDIFTQRG